MTLVEFLRARLVEDEQAARATAYSLASSIEDPWSVRQKDRRDEMSWAVYSQGKYLKASELYEADARHIARHDPARVLAEVDAKRRLIAEVWDEREGFPTERTPGNTADTVLRHLALPYAEHPDYDEAWRP